MFVKGIPSDKSIKFCDPEDTRWRLADPIEYETPTMLTFGSYSTAVEKWIAGIPAANGKIYCIPYNGTSLLEIDVDTKTCRTIGSVSSTAGKWQDGVLLPNGKIICLPRNAGNILEIDTHSIPQKDYMCWHRYFNNG